MKDSTLRFAKNYKTLLYILNFVIIFAAVLLMFRVVDYSLLAMLLPWISAPLVMLDLWISFCFLAHLLLDSLEFSYKKIIGEFLLISTIFYNSIHVFLSFYFSLKLSISWYFFYGCYHLIFALALYFILKNYKSYETRHSAKTLKNTGFIIIANSLIFLIIIFHVLYEQERISIHNNYVIHSLAVVTVFNLVISLYFIIKFRKSTRSNFIAHKYVNFSSAIFSIFFVQAIYINEFCEDIPLELMRSITLKVGIPCLFILIFVGIYLIQKAKFYTYKH